MWKRSDDWRQSKALVQYNGGQALWLIEIVREMKTRFNKTALTYNRVYNYCELVELNLKLLLRNTL